jgi:hypothetical protein
MITETGVLTALAIASPFFFAWAVENKPSWANGYQAMFIYGMAILALGFVSGMRIESDNQKKMFSKNCTERSRDFYVCDFRGSADEMDSGGDSRLPSRYQ